MVGHGVVRRLTVLVGTICGRRLRASPKLDLPAAVIADGWHRVAVMT